MDWTQFNWVDWAFAAVLVYGAVMGLVRGLSSELATLIGMVVSVIVTRLFYEPVSFWVCARWGWNEQITRQKRRKLLVGDAFTFEAAQQRRGYQHNPDSRLRQSFIDFAEQSRAEEHVLLAEPN